MNAADLARQFDLAGFTVTENTEGLSNEEGLTGPPAGGNCANWVLGHILAARNRAFPLLGLEPFWDAERQQRYDRGSPPVTAASAAVPFPDLVRTFGRTQEQLRGALQRVDAAALAARLPQPDSILGETVGSALVALSFHEAYHAGQLAILRRLVGKEGKLA